MACILTEKERYFLSDYSQNKKLEDKERQYLSSITRKTKKALKDLEIIFEKLPQPYLLFSEEEEISYWKPIKEVTTILFFKNYQTEFRRRLKDKTKRQIDIEIIRQRTKKQLRQFIDSVLEEVKLP